MYETYRTLSSSLGLSMSPTDPGLMTFFVDLDGSVDGRAIHVRRVVGSGGFVVVQSPVTPPLDAGLVLARTGPFGQLLELLGFHDLQVGDDVFDQAFRIKAKKPERAREVLGPEVRSALLAMEGHVRLTDELLATTFDHHDEGVEILTRACHDVARVAALVR